MKHFIKRVIIAVLLPLHALARTIGLARPGIAVLMYHSVGEHDWEFSVSPATFVRRLDMLTAKGFRFIDLNQFERILGEKEPVPNRSALITFDDGYRDILDEAMPMMIQRHIRPILYLHTSRSGYELGNELPLLSWQEIRNLSDSIAIGSHSHAHPVMKKLNPEQLEADLLSAENTFRREIGYAPRTFAYPGGKFSERVIQAIRSHGFTTAFTINNGLVRPHDDAFRLRRIGVTAHTSDLELYAHAIGAGEWYGSIVHAIKKLFHL